MRVCSGAGCLRAVPDDARFCEECNPAPKPAPTLDDIRVHTLTDRERYRSLYSSPRWQRLRERVIRDQPLCARCEQHYSEIGDHIVPAGFAIAQGIAAGLGRVGGFFLRSNIQGLCRACHWHKTEADKTHVGPWPDVLEAERRMPRKRYAF